MLNRNRDKSGSGVALRSSPSPVSNRGIPNLPIQFEASSHGRNLADRGNSRSISKSINDIIRDTQRNLKSPGLEILRHCTHIFIRPTDGALSNFLLEAKQVYEVFDQKARRIYYVKEMEADGRRLSIGGTFDLIICILASDGRELLRLEGNRGQKGRNAVVAVLRNEKYLGEIKQMNHVFSDQIYSIKDENGKEILLVEPTPGQEKEKQCCGKICAKKRKENTENLYFDVNMPDPKSRISGMGKIAKFFTNIPRELDDCFGVECSDALNINERSLLLSSIFLIYSPERLSTKIQSKVGSSSVIGDNSSIMGDPERKSKVQKK